MKCRRNLLCWRIQNRNRKNPLFGHLIFRRSRRSASAPKEIGNRDNESDDEKPRKDFTFDQAPDPFKGKHE
jgi:hypothetical protein